MFVRAWVRNKAKVAQIIYIIWPGIENYWRIKMSFNFGFLLIIFFSFVLFSSLAFTALFATAMPLSRGLEYLFAKGFLQKRKAYLAALSALILTATITYVMRLFLVVSEKLRFARLDPFPGDIEHLIVSELINTLFIVIAVGVAAFRFRKLLIAADEYEQRSIFNIISILIILSLFNFAQTMLTVNNLIG